MKIFSVLIRSIEVLEKWVIPISAFLQYAVRFRHRLPEDHDLSPKGDRKVEQSSSRKRPGL